MRSRTCCVREAGFASDYNKDIISKQINSIGIEIRMLDFKKCIGIRGQRAMGACWPLAKLPEDATKSKPQCNHFPISISISTYPFPFFSFLFIKPHHWLRSIKTLFSHLLFSSFITLKPYKLLLHILFLPLPPHPPPSSETFSSSLL